ncbi:hypothetical protein [Geotalea sp. SG265]|uniref:hypothetical protein n=1 Tax=Geotalea sp. SG265 TaxID=2922867 RepID=UPI001FAFF196|nr:hypothetical protein [Geotalea sp. SG265]
MSNHNESSHMQLFGIVVLAAVLWYLSHYGNKTNLPKAVPTPAAQAVEQKALPARKPVEEVPPPGKKEVKSPEKEISKKTDYYSDYGKPVESGCPANEYYSDLQQDPGVCTAYNEKRSE